MPLSSRNILIVLPSRIYTPWCFHLIALAPGCVIVKLLMRTRLGTGSCYCRTAAQREALHTGGWLWDSSLVRACWHQHCWHCWPAGIDLNDTVGIDINNTVRVLALMLLLPLALILLMWLASIFLSKSTRKYFSRNKNFTRKKKRNKIALDPKYSRFYGGSSLNWTWVWIWIKIRTIFWFSKSIMLWLRKAGFQPLAIVALLGKITWLLNRQNKIWGLRSASGIATLIWVWFWLGL